MPKKNDQQPASPGAPKPPASLTSLIALAEIDNLILLQGIAYWRGLCRGQKFPARTDVTPRGLGNLLRNTSLLRVIDGGKDYEYRVVGDAHVQAYGFSAQGKRWSEIDKLSPSYHAMIKSMCDRVVRKAEPVAVRGWIERGGQKTEPIYGEYVFLPLGADGKTVDHILSFSVYVPRERFERPALKR